MWADSGGGTLNVEAGGEVSNDVRVTSGTLLWLNGHRDGHRCGFEVDKLERSVCLGNYGSGTLNITNGGLVEVGTLTRW